MAGTETVAKFVSQKIGKIRWQPTSRQVVQRSTVFACGSWDNGDDNHVSIWQIESGNRGDHTREALDGEPVMLCEASHRGDVTDLLYVNQDQLLVSSSVGSVSIYKHHTNSQTLSVSHTWEDLHRQTGGISSCTGVAMKGDDTFATVGEDGRINVLQIEHRNPSRTIEKADSCTLNSATFLKQSEIATVNSIGQLKVWDLRQQSDHPSRVFLLTGERVPLHCVDKHPTQCHIVATGGQDGTLCIWDMRQDKFPVTLLSAHSADMWELKFHPSHPDNLFSCSEDGSVWHWDRSNSGSNTNVIGLIKDTPKLGGQPLSTSLTTPVSAKSVASSPWLSSEASRHGLDITDLLTGNTMPVNTLDIIDNTLICGTDSEQIVAVQDIVIK